MGSAFVILAGNGRLSLGASRSKGQPHDGCLV
jgi:hypothetical protein